MRAGAEPRGECVLVCRVIKARKIVLLLVESRGDIDDVIAFEARRPRYECRLIDHAERRRGRGKFQLAHRIKAAAALGDALRFEGGRKSWLRHLKRDLVFGWHRDGLRRGRSGHGHADDVRVDRVVLRDVLDLHLRALVDELLKVEPLRNLGIGKRFTTPRFEILTQLPFFVERQVIPPPHFKRRAADVRLEPDRYLMFGPIGRFDRAVVVDRDTNRRVKSFRADRAVWCRRWWCQDGH